MSFQLWMANVLRGARLTVHEVSGWRTRSAAEDQDASTYRPHGVIIHETRGSATSTDAGELGVLVNGRVGLSGPIAQLYLSRSGEWWVVSAGLTHHVKTGWGGPFSGEGNTRLLGIEAQHAESEDWARKPVQYASYVKGVAAILKHTGWPAPVGHKEHQPGDKPDPEFNMNTFRRDVAAAMTGKGFLMALTDAQQDEIYDVAHWLNSAPAWAPAGYNRLRMLETLYYTQVLGNKGTETTWLAAQFRAVLDAVKAVPGIDQARVDEIEAELVSAVKQANGAAVADALRAGADAAEAGAGA